MKNFEVIFGTFIVIVIFASLAIMTLSNIQSTQTENSTEYNATGKSVNVFVTFNTFMPVFVMIMIGIFIIGMIVHLYRIKPGRV